jgi:hypothetical protein
MSGKNFSRPNRSGRAERAHQHAVHGAEEMRIHLAREAARIMAESGLRDFAAAKRKAAQRLAAPDTRHLPSNEEIEHELQQYLSLFQGKRLPQRVTHLRGIALEAMRFLSAFEPRLVGAVLGGAVTEGTIVEIHASADTPEAVAHWLDEHGIPFEQSERRLRFGGDRHEMLPVYQFTADDVTVEVCVFDRAAARENPLSPVDGKPMRRASLRDVEALAQQAPDGSLV